MKIDLTDSFWGENGEDELRIYTETTTFKIASQFCPAPHRGRALPFPPRAQVWGLPHCSKGHTSHTLGALTAQCTPDFQPWEQRSGRPGTDCSQLFLLHRGLLSRKAGWSFPQLWACYASRAGGLGLMPCHSISFPICRSTYQFRIYQNCKDWGSNNGLYIRISWILEKYGLRTLPQTSSIRFLWRVGSVIYNFLS